MEKSTTKPRRIAAHYVYTPQGVLRQGVVSVDRDGIITDVSAHRSVDSMAGVEYYSGMLVPGFVNAHSHLELSYLCSQIPAGGGFATFAASMGAVRNRFSEQERVRAAEFHDARMWSQGVDVVADICNGDTTFPLKRISNIKYINFVELFGLQTQSVAILDPVVESAVKSGLQYTVTPHSIYSLNELPFAQTVAQSDPSLPMSIHFMESEAENELFASRGDLWKWYEKMDFKVDFKGYGSAVNRIVSCVPANRRVMLIHNAFVTREDVRVLQAHFGDNLTWVLCPRSNNYIGNITPPFELLRQEGGRIAIGTDSLASNRSLSMIEELKMFADVPLTELLCWATLGGAEALGVQGEYGSIETGKKSGLVLLTDLDWGNMKLSVKSDSQRIL